MRWIGVLSALALVLAGCSIPLRDSDHGARASVAGFDAFPLYWVGDEFEQLPLSNFGHIVLPPNEAQRSLGQQAGTNVASLIYGSCHASSDSGCTTPLALQVSPACNRNLALYAVTGAFGIGKL